ncbi:MAG: DEAD/DEAH box helicase, partial [Verrucomicrobiota bacterium]|nr:DEAD/DEAH box helicase [Verrucomicrobiota bacterium]
MPLDFIKKLAGKLLSGSKPAKKDPAPRPGAQAPEKKGKNQRGGAASSPSGNPQNADRNRDRDRDRNRDRRFDGRDARRIAKPSGSSRPDGRTSAPKPQPPPQPQSPAPSADAAAPAASAAPAPDGRRRETRPDSRREAAPAAARAIIRPQREQRGGGRGGRGGGGDRDRVRGENTDPRAQRPGGATGDAEVATRLAEHAAWTVDQYQVAPEEGKKRFHDFDLPSELMHAVADMGFTHCTPIQSLSLEHALAGKNVAGKAQTGTGKTAAFLVAILTRYLRTPESRHSSGGAPRALVIAPTRELVIQICKDASVIGKYCNLRSLAVYGGMDYDRQKREVSDAPVDLLVATPGRLLDFVRSRIVDLSQVDTLVIDEADRMLDMGFIPDVRAIVNRLPPKEKRCTMLYSATLDDAVMRLASQWMEDPVKVEVESESVTTKTVKQIVYVVTSEEKFTVLYNLLQQYPDSRTLIFCNRRGTTEDVAESLARRGIRCEMLSGDVNQNRRLRVLEDFREGKVRTVVATDVAGRGLHVDDIGFVVNFDFPYEPEDYVHRIGRTGRAGHTGTAISFADENESFIIPEIEKFIGEELKCTALQNDDPLLTKLPPKPPRTPRHEEPRERRDDGPGPDAPAAEPKAVEAEAPAPAAEAAEAPVAAPAPVVAAPPAPVAIPAPVAPAAPRPPARPPVRPPVERRPPPPPPRHEARDRGGALPPPPAQRK